MGEAAIKEGESGLSLVFIALQADWWEKSRAGGEAMSGVVDGKLVVGSEGEGRWVCGTLSVKDEIGGLPVSRLAAD